MTGADAALFGGLIVALFLFLWIDLHFFARGRSRASARRSDWSIGWLALSLLAAIPVWLLEGSEDAVLYTTVYLIERSLSLDNLFVFILLFSYFGVPTSAGRGCSTGASSPRWRCAACSSSAAAS